MRGKYMIKFFSQLYISLAVSKNIQIQFNLIFEYRAIILKNLINFSKAQDHVFKLMQKDTYMRFVKTLPVQLSEKTDIAS